MKRKLKLNRIGLFALAAVFSLLLASCSFPGMVSTAQQLPQTPQTPQAQTLPPVRFPQDEGAHRNLTEWWYYTGHLQATDAAGKPHTYGFELVVFQALRSTFPPVYASHFAISDITRGEFHYDQRRVTEPDALKQPQNQGINVTVGDWSIKGHNGSDQLKAAMSNYAIQLALQGSKQPTLHNGNGLITYGLAGYSYYYSRTRMAVSGSIVDHNQTMKVTGQAWMDHQWGDFLTLSGSGWDWYSIQLANNSEMMLYFIRDASGKIISTYGGYIDASGNNHLIDAKSISSQVLGKWTSPKSGFTYPSGWQVTINDPVIQARLTIQPLLKDQELLAYQSTGNSYWEGAVSIQGQSAGKSVQGEGYIELTGYGK